MKKRVVLDVDDLQLFDMLSKMKGDTSAIGSRLVETLLSADVSLSTAIGLGVYGIELAEVMPLPAAQAVVVGANVSFTTQDEGSGP